MNLATDLIQSYVASGSLPSTVQTWYLKHQPNAEALSLMAESIGAAFLARTIGFECASGLMNHLMPCIGFDSAPQRFWQYYVAFEDLEVSGNPDEDARLAIQKVANEPLA
jgi:hypothetical protein